MTKTINTTTLNSILALSAALQAAGDDRPHLAAIAPFAQLVAKGEPLADPNATYAEVFHRRVGAHLPADLVPWSEISADAVKAVRAVVSELAAYAPALRELYADLDDLARRLEREPNPRVSLALHVLSKRNAAEVRFHEKQEAAKKEATDRRIAEREKLGARSYDARVTLNARGITLVSHPPGNVFAIQMGDTTTHRGVSIDEVETFIASLPPATAAEAHAARAARVADTLTAAAA